MKRLISSKTIVALLAAALPIFAFAQTSAVKQNTARVQSLNTLPAQFGNKLKGDILIKPDVKGFNTRSLENASGGMNSGGGDLCENRIKIVRDDIKEWILKGGFNTLNLPPGVSKQDYRQGMLMHIAKAQVSCVSKSDPGYPIQIDGVSKICRFTKDSASESVVCDRDKFKALDESDQYILVHHEYAGLADIERPLGSNSMYDTSNQITRFLSKQVVKKLVISPIENVDYCNIVNGADANREILFNVIRGSNLEYIREGRGSYFSTWVRSPDKALKALDDLEKQGFCQSVVTPQYCKLINGSRASGKIIFNVIRNSDLAEIKQDRGAYFWSWVNTPEEAQNGLQTLRSLGLCL